MRGGFTFKGIHSSVYGVKETPSKKVLSPLKRRTLITIPGRSTPFIEEDGGYEPRVESIICSYAKPTEATNIYQEVRKIAGWLNGTGELTFDYEPTMHYRAYLSSSPPNVTMLKFAQFQLEFTYVHPFAYESAIQQDGIIGIDGGIINKTMTVETEGSVETPVRIIITNITDQPMTDIKVYHKYIEI